MHQIQKEMCILTRLLNTGHISFDCRREIKVSTWCSLILISFTPHFDWDILPQLCLIGHTHGDAELYITVISLFSLTSCSPVTDTSVQSASFSVDTEAAAAVHVDLRAVISTCTAPFISSMIVDSFVANSLSQWFWLLHIISSEARKLHQWAENYLNGWIWYVCSDSRVETELAPPLSLAANVP